MSTDSFVTDTVASHRIVVNFKLVYIIYVFSWFASLLYIHIASDLQAAKKVSREKVHLHLGWPGLHVWNKFTHRVFVFCYYHFVRLKSNSALLKRKISSKSTEQRMQTVWARKRENERW